jgi:hypothetical protein
MSLLYTGTLTQMSGNKLNAISIAQYTEFVTKPYVFKLQRGTYTIQAAVEFVITTSDLA